ncbi:MAG: hypothetical protein CSA55_02400 [Ilumatobacter coccineus]|uniref:Uncharacterized protein n=1 Tax=Ilumatobacter coccineus TaxID=467094 RepID=A0A2G6KBM6_9ACTN|nr:MAG: hypothetical protein CSA55_02400 [Ilumatobacter coccineus]
MRPHRPRQALIIVAVVSALMACQPADEDEATADCRTIVAEAAAARDVDDTIRLLDKALLLCPSFEVMAAELDAHPGIVGYSSEGFIRNRCASIDAQRAASALTCDRVTVPSTSAPVVTTAPVEYSGLTMDDRTVTLTPDDGITFVGDLPAEIQNNLDAWTTQGCDGIVARRDRWAAEVEAGRGGDAVSVYARHADHLVDYGDC